MLSNLSQNKAQCLPVQCSQNFRPSNACYTFQNVWSFDEAAMQQHFAVRALTHGSDCQQTQNNTENAKTLSCMPTYQGLASVGGSLSMNMVDSQVLCRPEAQPRNGVCALASAGGL